MSDVPDEAREAAFGAAWKAYMQTPGSNHQSVIQSWRNAVDEALNAAAPFLVAAERQRLHDRIEALAAMWLSQQAEYPTSLGGPEAAAAVRCCVRELRALVSPVSDDAGGTKP